ncbi:MAG: hypothetical protein KAR06_02890 [Deltaproteobacteria bacterium]|nr:hypothetical protein [Deltaproteobacteria bacterium]
MHEVEYEEGKELAQNFVCGAPVEGGPCGAELLLCWGGTWSIDGYVLRCAANDQHQGMIERTTLTQEHRRGKEAPFPLSTSIERKMMPREDIQRSMNLLGIRYPAAIDDPATASLFILDCLRLDLDPLISPAEAVPVTFTNRRTKKKTVTMIITEDGWLSMAARGCPDRFAGAPRVEPVNDRALAESLCGDADAWLWKAIGRARDMAEGQESSAYGWFTKEEHKQAKENHTPAARNPGNQARIRAIKRWVRENFPECRQKMIEYTRDLIARSPETKAAQDFVDAEYSIIIKTEIDQKRESEAEGKLGGHASPDKRATDSGKREKAGTTNFREAKTSPKKSEVPAAAAAGATVAGIDTQWLGETLKEINWNPDTTISFVVSRYKVSPEGNLIDVLSKLTREQAEDFVKELQGRLSKQQPQLFT